MNFYVGLFDVRCWNICEDSGVWLIRILVQTRVFLVLKEYFDAGFAGNNDGPNETEASTDHFLLLGVFRLAHSSFHDTACVTASLSLEEP